MGRARADIRLALFRMLRGRDALQAAVSVGQHAHPLGLFYGGRVETWSNRTVRAIVAGHFRGAAHVVYVDFHTGLGPHGHGELILTVPRTSAPYGRARDWWGERTRTTDGGESVSAEVKGTIDTAITAMLPGAQVTAVALEFGTQPVMRVLGALRAENWLFHHGGPDHVRAPAIRAAMGRAFYPETELWKERVWTQSREVVERALLGLTA